VIKKRTAKFFPKKHIASKDAAADVPRTSNKDDITEDLAATEVDKDNSTAGALSNNNVTGKAAAAEISNTAHSKEDSVLVPSTVAPNTVNMPPSIYVSSKCCHHKPSCHCLTQRRHLNNLDKPSEFTPRIAW
jgi:hypothetical protein